MIFRKTCMTVLLLSPGLFAAAPEKSELKPENYDKLHQMIKPQKGEAHFREIPWLLSVWEARTKAAAEGKPMLIWSGSGGPPLGVC